MARVRIYKFCSMLSEIPNSETRNAVQNVKYHQNAKLKVSAPSDPNGNKKTVCVNEQNIP